MMIVTGTLFLFISQLYQILVDLSILSPHLGSLNGIPLLSLALKTLPYLSFTIGFIIFLIKKRRFG